MPGAQAGGDRSGRPENQLINVSVYLQEQELICVVNHLASVSSPSMIEKTTPVPNIPQMHTSDCVFEM